MTDALAVFDPQDAALAAEAATTGDLSKLSPDKRAQLYGAICRSTGLNPLTQPFAYIMLNNKLTLYALRGATDQLRKINGVNVDSVLVEEAHDILTVTVKAHDKHGRSDMDIGAVNIKGLAGESLANAHMKAVTKAKRRLTLSICGLGWLDETEVQSIPDAIRVDVNTMTGEIIEPTAIEAGKSPEQTALDEAKRQLWDLAFTDFAWGNGDKDTCVAKLDEVSVYFMKHQLAALNIQGLEELRRYMLAMEPDEREAVKAGESLETIFPVDVEQAALVDVQPDYAN